jgi:hypothetical protein
MKNLSLLLAFLTASHAFSAKRSFPLEEPPAAPVNLVATPISDRGIDLHWTDASTTEDSYIIMRATGSNPFYPIDTLTTNSTFFRDESSALQPERTYLYRVVARNSTYPAGFGAETSVTTFSPLFVNEHWLERSETNGVMSLLGDYDRDGDLDLVLTYGTRSEESKTRLFRFNGEGYEYTGIQFDVRAYSARWFDYNNDGYIDLVLNNGDSNTPRTALYKNERGMSFSKINGAFLPSAIRPLIGISFGDYDNDGDEDALVQAKIAYGSPMPPTIHLYDNDGKGNFTRNTEINLTGHVSSTNAWADYDRDGDLDILANIEKLDDCSTNQLVVFENNGDKTFVPVEFSTLSGINSDYLNFMGDMEWGDHDNDGYPDIVVAGQNMCNNGSNINHIYRNNGNKTFSHVSTLVPLGYDVNVDWGDYDNDGDLDLFAFGYPLGGYLLQTRLYRNDGTSFKETSVDYLLQSTQHGKTSLGDIDKDGDLDYVMLGESDFINQEIVVYKSVGVERWGRKNHKPSAPQNLRHALPADLSVTLSWNAAEDTETAPAGLTYNLYVVHQMDSLIVNSYSMDNGSRMIVSPGNVSGTNMTLKHLKPGKYRWAVQAIDKGFEASEFSTENMFEIMPEPEEPEEPVVGVDDVLLAGLQLYPNPVGNYLTVVSHQQRDGIQLQVMNTIGQPVGTIALDKPEITYDLSRLPSGLYVVVISRNGTRVGTKKIVKK